METFLEKGEIPGRIISSRILKLRLALVKTSSNYALQLWKFSTMDLGGFCGGRQSKQINSIIFEAELASIEQRMLNVWLRL